jgi:hypothetical protein
MIHCGVFAQKAEFSPTESVEICSALSPTCHSPAHSHQRITAVIFHTLSGGHSHGHGHEIFILATYPEGK